MRGSGIRRGLAAGTVVMALMVGAVISGMIPQAFAVPAAKVFRAAPAVSPPAPGPQPVLQAAQGEFFSVPLFRVLDTRSGTGRQAARLSWVRGRQLG